MSKPRLQGVRTLARAMLFLVTLSGCGGGDVVGPDEGGLPHLLYRPLEIYRMNADGSGVVRLSDVSPFSANSPAWSPCGAEIAFNILELDGWGIHVMDGDGSNVRRLTDDGRAPSWSPDCSKIAFWRQVGDEGQQMDIWTINADGSGLMELTHGEGGGGGDVVCGNFGCFLEVSGDSQPAWSPNGSEIAIVRTRLLPPRGSEIHLIDLLGNAVQLTNGLGGTSFPSWSPDGLRIAFTGNNAGIIYVIGRDGSGLTEFQTNLQIAGVAWSPDGETIAFWTIGGSIETHIYLFDIGTSVVTRWTQPGSSNHHLSWSPDGSQAVFSSNGVELVGSVPVAGL